MRRFRLAALALLAALGLSATAGAADSPVPVRIQLKWLHQFQFAGYYAALDKGYFRDAGLDVELIEGAPDLDPADEVLAGRAEFGIGTSGLLVARSSGRPVVAVAAVFQHSPYLLLARDDPAIRDPRDLMGRRVMIEPHAEELFAYLHRVGVDIGQLRMLAHSGDPFDLETGRTDAMTAYTTTEPFVLDRAGVGYRVFDPKMAGIDFYGDTLFTSEAYAEANEDVVVAVRDTVVAGWLYALAHPDEIIELMRREYDDRLDPEHQRFIAYDIRRLLIPDLIEIGYMNRMRWARIAEAFDEAGLMPEPVPLDAFLFEPSREVDWTWVYLLFLATSLVTLAIAAALWKHYTLNRHLQAEVAARRLLQDELETLAVTDPLTGVLNRRGFFDEVGRALHRADRAGNPVTLLAVDLDRFKAVNDSHGHAAGDLALARFAALCRETVRGGDVIGRLGGEEFGIALPDSAAAAAREVAERLRRAVAATPVAPPDGPAFSVTVSIGLVEREPGEGLDRLMSRADAALYRAKEEGRNRTVVGDPAGMCGAAAS